MSIPVYDLSHMDHSIKLVNINKETEKTATILRENIATEKTKGKNACPYRIKRWEDALATLYPRSPLRYMCLP